LGLAGFEVRKAANAILLYYHSFEEATDFPGIGIRTVMRVLITEVLKAEYVLLFCTGTEFVESVDHIPIVQRIDWSTTQRRPGLVE
jgi:hypothetical protein